MRRDHDPSRPSHGRISVLSVAAVALVVSCGGSGSDADTTTTVEETTTTVEANTTTTEAVFTETSDLVYMTVDGQELLMDVYTPVGDGPWPVVVAFHGLDSRGKDSADTVSVASAAAAEGMLVFAASWIVWDPPPFPFTISSFDGWKQVTNCAIAFAQENAAALGGDPDTTVLHGFSGGSGAALIAAGQPITGPIDGCETDASPVTPVGAVLGDGVYFVHNEDFDVAFEADLEGMQAQVAALVDPASWPEGSVTEFRLWVAQDGTNPRTIVDASDEDGWLALRDPTGSIRADLERLGQLEDGVISTVDAGELLALRLSEAGRGAALDAYPGGHSVGNKVAELVGYLKELASQ